MKEKHHLKIRKMTVREVAGIALEWAAEEGWNPGLHDALPFYKTDPGGYLVGLIEGEPVACISAVAYNPDFAFIGFLIVKPGFRGKGYGMEIWNAAMKGLPTHNIGLDGVVEQQHNYKKSGFKLAYRNIRFERAALQTTERFGEIVPLSEIPFNELIEYDSRLFPVPRSTFLKSWIEQPQSHAIAAVRNGKLSAYGLIRKCRSGYKIGPLFANDTELADKIFLTLNNHAAAGEPVYLDTPEVNRAAVRLAEHYGMQKVFETARMYTKYQPDIDLNRVYGVTTFELG